MMRNILAAIIGIAFGSMINMLLIMLSPMLIPPPTGVDVTTTEGLAASIHLFELKHFIFPFLAHALGTLLGALAAYFIAYSAKRQIAYGVGCFFLLGGIASSVMIPAPAWFIALDLLLAYLPMAYLAVQLNARTSR